MTAIKCTEEVLAVAEGNNKFILDFHQKIRTLSDRTKNIFYSGVSTTAQLAIMWDAHGYKDKKSEQAARLLNCLSVDPDKAGHIRPGFSEVLREYEKAVYGPHDTVLNIVNKMYTCSTLGNLTTEFRDILLGDYRCSHEMISFSGFSSFFSNKTVDKINDDFSKASNDLVKEVVTQDMVSSSSKILLVSSFYFKGVWEVPFNPELTKMKPFTNSYGAITNVPMMYKHKAPGMSYTNLRSMGCHACAMYFEGFRFCMIVVRPTTANIEGQFFTKLEEVMKTELTPASLIKNFKRYHGKSRRGEGGLVVNISMPRFRIQRRHLINSYLRDSANSPWARAGSAQLHQAFEKLPRLANPSVTNIIQHAYIDINETGAPPQDKRAPVLLARPQWKARPKTVKMNLDRTFYFVLFDYTNNFLIAAGIVDDPNEGLI